MKRIINFGLLLLPLFLVQCSVKEQDQNIYGRISGQTMGTNYSIVGQFSEEQSKKLKSGIDSLLVVYNNEVSTYIPESIISLINQSSEREVNLDELVGRSVAKQTYLFEESLSRAKAYRSVLGRAFEPTIMPLVNYWGFGYTGKEAVEKVDTQYVEKLLTLVDFDSLYQQDRSLYKKVDMQLDMSAFAKGLGVDFVGEYLESKGVVNYLVEIGGEMRSKGVNERGESWRVGISTPLEDAAPNEYEQIISLNDQACATSGNYRIFYKKGDHKYAHIINPLTGFSETSSLLSVTVLAPNCGQADAAATAFMVMGLDAAKMKIEAMPNMEACFIYITDEGELQTHFSSGMRNIAM